MNSKLKDKAGIRLDIGGGQSPNPGFVNIDIEPFPTVDIVHDLEVFPWPLDDESVLVATASHVLEHINPHKGVFIKFMDEVWRVLKPGGQFAFVVPHAHSNGYAQDPTHVNMINETTMHYFDPDPEGASSIGNQLYNFYKPKPWKIESQYFSPTGILECLLTKRRDDKTFQGHVTPGSIVLERR
jgi:SAM-dependent methyltransferase